MAEIYDSRRVLGLLYIEVPEENGDVDVRPQCRVRFHGFEVLDGATIERLGVTSSGDRLTSVYSILEKA